jgi:hypothetical protein
MRNHKYLFSRGSPLEPAKLSAIAVRTIFLLNLAIYLVGGSIRADDGSQPIVVEQKKSTSPNKFYYVALEQEIPNDGADCSLQIRTRIDKKVLATFDWEQFWDRLSDDGAVKWTNDSKAFAISGFFGRGWSGSLVFFHLPNGSWTQIEIPEPDTGHSAKDGWETRDKGGYCADRWLSNDVLVMDYLNPTYRLKNPATAATTNVFDAEWAPSHFSVSLRLTKSLGGKPIFKQIALHELPDR